MPKPVLPWKNIPSDPLSQDAYRVIHNTNDPTINELIGLLDRGGTLPSFTQQNGNGYSVSKNQVSVSPSSFTINSFAHEYTHALNNALYNLFRNNKVDNTPTGYRLQDMWSKLQGIPTKLIPQRQLTPWEQYRYSPDEAPAWAVGNMANDDGLPVPSKPPQHLDPTLATEQAMLREAYNRWLRERSK